VYQLYSQAAHFTPHPGINQGFAVIAVNIPADNVDITCRIVKHLGQSTIKEVDRRKIAERPHRDRIGTAEMDS
jgi:hypothetical protein